LKLNKVDNWIEELKKEIIRDAKELNMDITEKDLEVMDNV